MGTEERRRPTWGARRVLRGFDKYERPGSLRGPKADEAIADLTRTLGPRHPDILKARDRQAYWLHREGDTAGALVRLESLVADRTEWFGSDDLDAVKIRSTMARYRRSVGDLGGALALAEAVVTDLTWLHGPDERDTLRAESTLAGLIGQNGDRAEWLRRLRSLYERSRSLDPRRDSVTRGIRWNLVEALERCGEYREALTLLDVEIDAERRTSYGVDENLGDWQMKRLQEWRRNLVVKVSP
ncbi:hypothetical protein QFZ22_005826 [Streptomyces canus]|uniref:Tetratricopeptide repeat protein n=1 Tax=Streptomyces canus TaxID=58343 RepID=A0AAW8FI66_9ACTN|nr:hypothetical protein [Streptomyces canus]MDQ0909841.1 hypothetical protein [Streptomyces canus]